MSPIYIILTIVYILVCVALVTIILLQKKRSSGLGGLSGMGMDQSSYWDKNKGRSIEGRLEMYTKVGAVIFFVLTMVMCILK